LEHKKGENMTANEIYAQGYKQGMEKGFKDGTYLSIEKLQNSMKKTFAFLDVKEVIFNEPATIVYWMDGSKTVVKTQNGEHFDKEKGLAMAYVKSLYGNAGNYYEIFKAHCKEKSKSKTN
jgi:hypothetical protein